MVNRKHILELKAFYDWLELNPISTSAIVLWHALMSVANKTYWQTELHIPISILQMKTGLKKDAIIYARNILCDTGRITSTQQAGQKSCVYSLISFAKYDKPFEIASVKPPVYKQDYTKQNNTKPSNKKSSFDIDELDKFWDTVPKL
ncbi:MAG: hypothetical protein WAX04_04790 [Oscillospiraceae bacterium]